MPRKAKDEKNIKSEEEVKEKKKTTKSTTRKTSSKANANTTKATAKKSSAKSSTTKTASAKKASKSDSEETVKKATRKTTKKTSNSVTPKATTSSTKKTTSKTTKKTASTRKTAKASKSDKDDILDEPKVEIIEYYDLPYRYNQTVVKILAQTPNVLFVYWDISDIDRENFINNYGNDFFNNTVPILLVINKTMNYSYEVEINDFANSWYLHVNDANCEYKVELGRRTKINSDYYHITTSNDLNMPNDHILFENIPDKVLFRNVKTQESIEKPITTIKFFKEFAKSKDFYNYFKKLLNDELTEDGIKLTLPSSHTSSSFK